MTKKVLAVMLLLAASSVWAENADSLLYWMVSQPEETGIEFNYARVAAVNGNETVYLSLWDDQERKPVDWCLAYSDETQLNTYPEGDVWRSYMGSEKDWSEYLFCVELLMGEEDSPIGRSALVTYDTLLGLKAIESASNPLEPRGSWTVSGFSSVPEPTSGLLSLIGLAALALRRKKNV